MALTGPAKLTIVGVIVGGGITGSALIASSKSIKHPPHIQKLLDWERANGGCKVFYGRNTWSR